jgi:adenosylcobinamide-phosphate synthase
MTEAVILTTAVALDLLIGDPVYRFHPVRLIGSLITVFERILRALRLDGIAGGALLVMAVTGVTAGAYLILRRLFDSVGNWAGVALAVFSAYSCIALRDLIVHAQPVAGALELGDYAVAREAVGKMVGRDTGALDGSGIARATVESVAEGFVDGFLSPLFWFVTGACVAARTGHGGFLWGTTAMLVFKVVSTLDSMVGYENREYRLFGRASAKLDDAANFLPARLSLPVLWLAALVCRLDANGGWRTAMRDRLKHASPNAAHAESFVAGALGIRLGGPTLYHDGIAEKPWLGDGAADAGARHVRAVCNLVLCAGIISTVTAAICLFAVEAA